MEIIVNQQKITVSPEATLTCVLREHGALTPKGIAVAINEVVIPNKRWDTIALQPNDRIDIIKAAQGG